MGQFSKVLFAIDNAHTVPQRAMDCGPGLGKTTFPASINTMKGALE